MVGVTKNCRLVTSTKCHASDIVEAIVKWGAIGNDAMVHLVGARIQTCSSRRAGCCLTEMVSEPHTVSREFVKVWCTNNLMSGTRKAVAAKLVEGHQQDVWLHNSQITTAMRFSLVLLRSRRLWVKL